MIVKATGDDKDNLVSLFDSPIILMNVQLSLFKGIFSIEFDIYSFFTTKECPQFTSLSNIELKKLFYLSENPLHSISEIEKIICDGKNCHFHFCGVLISAVLNPAPLVTCDLCGHVLFDSSSLCTGCKQIVSHTWSSVTNLTISDSSGSIDVIADSSTFNLLQGISFDVSVEDIFSANDADKCLRNGTLLFLLLLLIIICLVFLRFK
jgi:hypothetical protein